MDRSQPLPIGKPSTSKPLSQQTADQDGGEIGTSRSGRRRRVVRVVGSEPPTRPRTSQRCSRSRYLRARIQLTPDRSRPPATTQPRPPPMLTSTEHRRTTTRQPGGDVVAALPSDAVIRSRRAGRTVRTWPGRIGPSGRRTRRGRAELGRRRRSRATTDPRPGITNEGGTRSASSASHPRIVGGRRQRRLLARTAPTTPSCVSRIPRRLRPEMVVSRPPSPAPAAARSGRPRIDPPRGETAQALTPPVRRQSRTDPDRGEFPGPP